MIVRRTVAAAAAAFVISVAVSGLTASSPAWAEGQTFKGAKPVSPQPTPDKIAPGLSVTYYTNMFQKLNEIGIPTHFIRRLNMREQLIRQVEIIPLEVIVRNFAAGSMAQRLGLEEGTSLPRPIVEFCYKDDKLGDPLVPEEYIIAFGWAAQQDLDDIVALALRVNDFLSGVFHGVGIRLVDFKIEVGRIWDGDFPRLVVADEISPDSCRLWDIETGRKLDKDVFRKDLGSLTDAYTEVARRLGVLPSNVTHRPKPTLIN
jgi:phosphoribosylaminoimidazole-succinocarboxamide synthase